MRGLTVLLGSLVMASTFSQAVEDDLSRMSIEELLAVPVTLQRRAVSFADVPAAVSVLTAQDIRRMGFSSIPEALRMVAGMDVAQIDGSSWAISSRGFNGRFANKLLVLVDGQIVYTPNFSGVFWDAVDLPLGVLDRIEVIRGPGGTLFGPNAVNGIINIITKPVQSDTSTSVDTRFESRSTATGSAVVELPLGTRSGVRLYGQTRSQGAYRTSTGVPGNDDWSSNRFGARFDWTGPSGDFLMVSASGYRGDIDRHMVVPTFVPPFVGTRFDHVEQSALNILGKYLKKLGDTSLTIQVAYDRSNRTVVDAREDRKTFDVDISSDSSIRSGFSLQAGLGYRRTEDNITGSFLHAYTPDSKTDQRFSSFVQGTWRLSPKTDIIAGAKVMHDEYAAWQVQPSLRVIHRPTPDEHLWGAVTRAVRTPARADRTVSLIASSQPGPGGLPLLFELQGSPDFREESVISLEAGYRRRCGAKTYFDLASYFNVYDDLRTFEEGDIQFRSDPAPHWVIPAVFANRARASTMGTELEMRFAVSPSWRIALTGSIRSWRYRVDRGSRDLFSRLEHLQAPKHQIGLQSYIDLGGGWTFNTFLSYVDALGVPDVDAYWRLDARLSCLLREGTEVELGVRNAFRPAGLEFPQLVRSIPSQPSPTLYFGAKGGF